MSDIIKTVESILLDPSDVDALKLEKILSGVMTKSCDFADVYLQDSIQETWFLEDGIVKDADYSADRGFGLRVISGEKVGFAYADNLNASSLEQAVSAVKSVVRVGETKLLPASTAVSQPALSLYLPDSPMLCLTDAEKVHLLQKMDQYARKQDSRIKRVFVRLESSFDSVMVLDSDGELSADLRPLVHMSIQVLAEQNGKTEQGRAGGGARADLNFFLTQDRAMCYVDKAVRQALLNLDAQAVPAGVMPVVLGPGWPAVLLHEAVGHGLEADFNRKGSSVFSGRVGEKVASSLCTIVDDATAHQARGSLNIDDEGTAGQSTMLIENGVLKGYMTDKHNAKLMQLPLTGNGRRESYACPPLPRMTSTYMMPGEADPGDIIASVDRGLYAVDFAGGQVDISSGKFVFTMSEAYLIEKGKVSHPIKGATLIGNGTEVLAKVSMVGNDLEFDPGIGHCGKDGQTIAVGVGQPTLKLDAITVGGTRTQNAVKDKE